MSPLNSCTVRGPFTLQQEEWCLGWCDAGWPTQKSDIPNQRFSSLQKWKRFLRSLCYENQTLKGFNFTQVGAVMLQEQIPFSGLCRPTGTDTLGQQTLLKRNGLKKPNPTLLFPWSFYFCICWQLSLLDKLLQPNFLLATTTFRGVSKCRATCAVCPTSNSLGKIMALAFRNIAKVRKMPINGTWIFSKH